MEQMLVFLDVVVWGTIVSAGSSVLNFMMQETGQFVLIILAFSLLYYTSILAKQIRMTRINDTVPHVVVTFEPSSSKPRFLDFVVENTGKTPAYNTQIQLSDDIIIDDQQRKLTDIIPLKYGVIKPAQQFRVSVARPEDFSSTDITFIVSNYSRFGKLHKAQMKGDIEPYVNQSTNINAELDLAVHIKSIADNIRHVTTGFKKLNVDVHQSDESKSYKGDGFEAIGQYKDAA